MSTSQKSALVIGASSGIASALIDRLHHEQDIEHIFAFSRHPLSASSNKLIALQCDYSETSIRDALASLAQSRPPLKYVFICNGLLHNIPADEQTNRHPLTPEKRLEQVDAHHLHEVFAANAITPMLWLKHLLAYLPPHSPTHVVVFSARVGSISDNRLGGWYSYRASKAALNMLVKTTAIEYARRNKHAKIITFHPGTTDTSLSAPFQQNLGNKPLFTPEFVANQLLELLPYYPADGQASFIDWQGKPIAW
ncbi:SDR family NAD(P)-dependent oxidoreductase [Motilimonas eburnea]|uniref:SDR family NAD(P)-dependent oxidoreductase n=1 Tax=Motilimonas eburnea TaxID=1737488 RepID=UPI001E625FD4|nr:SDR family NAD(P)-dependent oxidoreductase [Motilimonas eburnea]MCE2570918.1 SDR family NAD(P)-dependent oxidoreductase [Motilimonas eburnea]